MRPEALAGWFGHCAQWYCGRDYGSPGRNAYFFYRRVYGMLAWEAAQDVRGKLGYSLAA